MAWKIIVIPQKKKNYAQGGGITLCEKLTKTSLLPRSRTQSSSQGLQILEPALSSGDESSGRAGLARERNALLKLAIPNHNREEKLLRKDLHL